MDPEEGDSLVGNPPAVDWRHAVAEARPWFTRGILWTSPMIVFYAIVYAGFAIANGYSGYLYLTNVGKLCDKPLALSALLLGASGIFVIITLFAIIGLAWNSSGVAVAVRKDGECTLNTRVALVIIWGAVSLFQIGFGVAASLWVFGTPKPNCEASLVNFLPPFLIAFWIWTGILVVLSLIAMCAGGGSVVVKRPDGSTADGSDSKQP